LAAIVTFIAGVAALSALGLMVAAIVPNGDATPAVTNATLLPLAFVSNVFIAPFEDMPAWLEVLGDIFPLKHFAVAFSGAFNPTLSGSGFQWSAGPGEYAILSHLAVMVAWGLGATLVALRTFTWEPRGGERAPRRRRRPRQAAMR
jgi:ABC-2 type transport system permease protein